MLTGKLLAALMVWFFVLTACSMEAESLDKQEEAGFSFHEEEAWEKTEWGEELDVSSNGVPGDGICLRAELLLLPAGGGRPDFKGSIHVMGALAAGEEKLWVQSRDTARLDKNSITEEIVIDGKTYYKASADIPFCGEVSAAMGNAWHETVPFEEAVQKAITGAFIQFVGEECSYRGEILTKKAFLISMEEYEGYYGVSDGTAADRTRLDLEGECLVLSDGERTLSAETVNLEKNTSDPEASAETKRLYGYLEAVGRSEGLIYGHQGDTWMKAGTPPDGNNGFSTSDTMDLTGTIAGVVGMDTTVLSGTDFNAYWYNERIAGPLGLPNADIGAIGEVRANVKAAALLAEAAFSEGAVVTLSCHMPNFSLVQARDAYDALQDPEYGKYDFSPYTPKDLSGNPMAGLLPSGKYHAEFTAYLDMIADFAKEAGCPILFRPFHEANGGWFWWGKGACSAEQYREVFRFTVDYLRDIKDVHNFLYVYSVNDSENLRGEMESWYPGDGYVDLIGLDIYHMDPQKDDPAFWNGLDESLKAGASFSRVHGKVFAVTETGAVMSRAQAGDSYTALKRSRNADKDWFSKLLEHTAGTDSAYVLLWHNMGKYSGFHSPYAERRDEDGYLYGHEMMEDFQQFYSDGRSIFADTQKTVFDKIFK